MRFNPLLVFAFSLCSFLFFANNSFAQSYSAQQLDSLIKISVSENHSLEDRLKAYDILSWDVYLYAIPDSAVYYSELQYNLAAKHNKKDAMINALNTQAVAMKIIGNYPKAIELQERNISYYNEYIASTDSLLVIKGKRGKAGTLGNMGNIYRAQANYELAMQCFNSGLEIYSQVVKDIGAKAGKREEMGLANFYSNIGTILWFTHKYDEAMNSYENALSIFLKWEDKEAVAGTYRNIGMVYEDKNDYVNAKKYYLKSLELRIGGNNKSGTASSYNTLAVACYNLGEIDESVKYNLLSLKLAEEANSFLTVRDAQLGLFKAYQSKEEWIEAEKYLLGALSYNNKLMELNFPILSEKEKELLFTNLLVDYDELYPFALFRKEERHELLGIVYNMILKNKGMLLKSVAQMQNTILQSNDVELKKEYNLWIEHKTSLADLFSQGYVDKALEDSTNAIEKRLVKKTQEFADFNTYKYADWKMIAQQLKSNEAAIEFIDYKFRLNDTVTETRYAALIITATSEFPQMIALFEEKQLKGILGIKNSTLTGVENCYGKKSEYNTALYQLIWQPLELFLSGKNKIYYSPAGLLHKISFSALAKSNNELLIKNTELNLVSSSGVLLNKHNLQISKTSSAVFFGGINYSTTSTDQKIWKDLPGTKSEVLAVVDLLNKKKMNYSLYVGDEASEMSFKQYGNSGRILHIATHGFFFPDPDLIKEEQEKKSEHVEGLSFRSGEVTGLDFVFKSKNALLRNGLVFAGANDLLSKSKIERPEDGVLTALEVANLNLRNVQLLVLSACETGLGDVKGNEGVYGLQRAFKMSGVQFIIMSLWQVPDKETQEFMTLFYSKLIKSKNIRTAFSQTQLEMSRNYDPYYWAAFVLLE